MRALFCAFLLLAGLCVAAPAQTPSPKEFTAQFARALQAAMPSAKIRIVRDLQVDVERPDGGAATVSLANNYKDFTPDPKWFDAVIKAYAAALAKPMRHLAEGAYMITSHADYGASLVLADSIWSGDQIKVNGDIVVAVPAKDVILATGSRDRKNLKAMRQLTSDLAKGNGGLIETLFVYRKGRFVKFGRD